MLASLRQATRESNNDNNAATTTTTTTTFSAPLVVSLLGIRSHPRAQALVTDFVSQERRETFAYLYASIMPVNDAKLHSIDSIAD